METFIHASAWETENRYWWFHARKEILISLVEKYISPGALILDAGCGTGFIAEDLQKSFSLQLIDTSPEALEICAKKGLRGQKASILNLPFPDSHFDGICVFDVLYHKQVSPLDLAIKEIYRVLKPGGFVIISEPAYEWLRGKGNILDHASRRFTSQKLQLAFESAGFSMKQI